MGTPEYVLGQHGHGGMRYVELQATVKLISALKEHGTDSISNTGTSQNDWDT